MVSNYPNECTKQDIEKEKNSWKKVKTKYIFYLIKKIRVKNFVLPHTILTYNLNESYELYTNNIIFYSRCYYLNFSRFLINLISKSDHCCNFFNPLTTSSIKKSVHCYKTGPYKVANYSCVIA